MRLLSSLKKVQFDNDEVLLIISIDYSGDESVEEIAKEYVWDYGEKVILAYKENLGLKTHILKCGDYLEKFSLDAMAVLEDDLFVSPEMYHYMKGTVEKYIDNPKIAGMSLYKHEYNIFAKHPFIDFNDGGDTFFIQYAMSWGQIWLRNQWRQFRQWYDASSWEKMDRRLIPNNVLNWEKSWLKYHIMYCIDKDVYCVYPRHARSTDFSDPGTHNKKTNTSMQVPLCLKKDEGSHFNDIDDTEAVYDAFFENQKLKRYLNYMDLEIDLYGVKQYSDKTRYVLTRRVLPYKVIKQWGMALRPIEENIIENVDGEGIFLYDLSQKEKRVSNKEQKLKIFEYDLKGFDIVNSTTIDYCRRSIQQYIGFKFLKLIRKQ